MLVTDVTSRASVRGGAISPWLTQRMSNLKMIKIMKILFCFSDRKKDPPEFKISENSRERSIWSTESGRKAKRKVIEEVSVEELITLIGTVAVQLVTILKEDGCNTNVLSKDFVRRHRNLLKVKSAPIPSTTLMYKILTIPKRSSSMPKFR